MQASMFMHVCERSRLRQDRPLPPKVTLLLGVADVTHPGHNADTVPASALIVPFPYHHGAALFPWGKRSPSRSVCVSTLDSIGISGGDKGSKISMQVSGKQVLGL